MEYTDYLQRRDFIIELGKALHKFGTPAFRLEAHLTNVSQFLELDGYFMISPTVMTIVLWQPGEGKKHNYHIRVIPGDLDLGSLAQTDELVEELITGKRNLTEALSQIDAIHNKPAPFSSLTTLFAFGLTGGAFAMLMGTSTADVIGATLTSLVVFSLLYVIEKCHLKTEIIEPVVALASALFASGAAYFYPQINIPVVVLSGIIVFIPGLSITMGLKDLASRHLMSGTARVMDGIMSLFKLYFGAVLGGAVGNLLLGSSTYVFTPGIPEWSEWLAVPLLSISLVIIFKSRLQDAIWGIFAGVIAYIGSQVGTLYLGDSLGPFVGALFVGLYSNLYSRIANAPSIVVLLHGVVLLVPGSKAYIGLNKMVSGQSMFNLSEIGPQTFLIFMSILAGLMFANTLIPSRKSL